jgi:hypothetical protein
MLHIVHLIQYNIYIAVSLIRIKCDHFFRNNACDPIHPKSVGLLLSAGIVTVYGATDQPPYSPDIVTTDFHHSGPLKKPLTGDLKQTPTRSEPSPPGYRHLSPISVPEYGGTNIEVSVVTTVQFW